MSPYPNIRLKPKEGRRVRAGAPWAFSNEIEMNPAAKALAPGSAVNLLDHDGRPMGCGYFNPNSLIAVRLLDGASDVAFDADFFLTRLERALKIREALFREPFYRLVHAEGDFLPGLAVDRFGRTCVAQISTAGMERLLEPFLVALGRLIDPETVVLRADAPARATEGLPSYVRPAKGATKRLAVEENGVRYFADPGAGQKTGWYYDQRDNRAFISALASGKSVLDGYCYAGGFALAAAKAGAVEVTALDSSAPALALAEDSAAANGVTNICKFVCCDAMEEFERLGDAGQRFDIVIADPPPFVKSRKDLESGARAYRKLARLAARVVAPRGYLLLAACSHNISADRFAQECALGLARAGRKARLIRQAGAGPDHCVHPLLPESAYLKALVYAMD
jgi:23S rRNA (cytosine1962-C5)-methyltransferase